MTTEGVPRALDWKELCQLAVIEIDPAKLSHRISDARGNWADTAAATSLVSFIIQPSMPGSNPIDIEGQGIQEITQKIIDEQDPFRLLNLIVQLNVLLEAKRGRLKAKPPTVAEA